jgi:hypothetical protein
MVSRRITDYYLNLKGGRSNMGFGRKGGKRGERRVKERRKKGKKREIFLIS